MCNYYPWCFSLSPSLPAALGFSLPGAGTSAAAFQERYSVSANPHWPLQRLLPRCSPTRQPWREFRALPLDWNTENTNLLVNFGPAWFDFNSYEWAAQTWKFANLIKDWKWHPLKKKKHPGKAFPYEAQLLFSFTAQNLCWPHFPWFTDETWVRKILTMNPQWHKFNESFLLLSVLLCDT